VRIIILTITDVVIKAIVIKPTAIAEILNEYFGDKKLNKKPVIMECDKHINDIIID
jgi:hypothetical protein